ncbi:YheC/YheD family protein [Ornithinibacillus sp. BX22]|uniref:YheC/YheD family protein n=2 Tax=Ornithinibacillus TaxID=484508 RepID=A0A923L3F2_9BACI|nr:MULTISPECIES: YheC/YheD family protein [Ornithinibacillus]MBC5635701.1 YheC/YheD family protein [Ornithinibacillus hominis]MBS3679312.1 YheC/YheD family protein [Ornithinibacillus massiliensis]
MCLYNIRLINTDETKLKLNSSLNAKLQINQIKYTNLRFGHRVTEVSIEIDDSLKDNEILLAESLVDKLKLPVECRYNILVKNNELIFGPFIGIFLGEKETVVLKKLRFLNSYILRYQEINGVVFAFTLENINKADLLVEGYYYNPKLDTWEKATLPFPAAIYKRSTFTKEWREYFGIFYGNKLFNYNTFDKWNMYERLQQFPEALDLLPRTVLYQDSENLVDFLNEWGNIYIKPINGKKGLGIFNVLKEDNKYCVKTREKEANVQWDFLNEDELLTFMRSKLETKGITYIMQNTIDIHINQKVLDFRVGMDKDKHGNWQNIMLVSRISGENSIVSNRAISGGEIQRVSDVLKNIYGYEEEKVKFYERELVRNAKLVSEFLERTGLLIGKLAFDFAIDTNGRIWIIEINSRYPDDSLANKLGDKDVYFDIHHSNIMYTKFLTGFEKASTDFEVVPIERVPEPKNYKLIIAIPVKERKNYINNIRQELQKIGYPEKVSYNTDLKKVEIEFYGTRMELDRFIENIKFGVEHRQKSIISVKEV